jgi:tRNA(fMet)-specific endonuclease VapC
VNSGHRIEYVADTSFIIGLMRKRPAIIEVAKGKHFAITFVTMAELSLGALKADKPETAFEQILDVLSNIYMMHPSVLTPGIYATIFYDLEKRGQKIPINDIWIAAIAMQSGLPLLARDEHFNRIPGLQVIQC